VTVDRLLVTGAAGFIGSTAVDRLLAEGREVVGIDCFEPFYDRVAKERNLNGARASPGWDFAELDTRDKEGLLRLVERVRPDAIIDFAARAGVRDSVTDPWLYIDINVRGLQNTIAAARAANAQVVFASSSSVYGTSASAPFREDDMRCRPESPYGATKVAGEALLQAHHALTGLPIRVARLFTVFGPRQRPDLAVRKFATLMLEHRPVPLYAEGTSSRDYTYVDDIVDGVIRLVDAPHDELTVNLGGHQPHTNLELVGALERVLDVRADVELMPAQPGDVPATYAAIERARDSLGWQPRIGFEAGLEQFAEWFRRERQHYAGGATR
jgi:UDP-glucuronate 4-epimerase